MGAAMVGENEARISGAWRQPVLAVGLTLWLGAYWFSSDAGIHRLSLFVLVLPGVLLNLESLKAVMRRESWVYIAVGLLVYQWLSRSWSGGEGDAVSEGHWLDVMMMMVLLGGMLAVAESALVRRWILPTLGVIAALGSLYSLLVYYSDADRSVAEDLSLIHI